MDFYKENNWGRMFVQKPATPLPWETWAWDNGAYVWWKRGEDFNEDIFLKRLKRDHPQGKPYLAVAPDILTQGKRSLEYSLSWIDDLPSDWPWYLAVQDGMEYKDVETVVHKFAGLFLGGSDKFKYTAWHWKQLAHNNGLYFHYGRAGTKRKIIHAAEIGVDSLDSAWPLWTVERREKTAKILKNPLRQASLFLPEEIYKEVEV